MPDVGQIKKQLIRIWRRITFQRCKFCGLINTEPVALVEFPRKTFIESGKYHVSCLKKILENL